MSRPTLLTKPLLKRICRILAEGNSIETSSAASGVSGRTFHNWMERGERDGKGIYFQFFQGVTRARAEAKISLTSKIVKAAPRDWKAAAWLLERMFPQEYGRSTREDGVATKLNPIAPPNIRIHVMSDKESQKLLAEARPAQAHRPSENGAG